MGFFSRRMRWVVCVAYACGIKRDAYWAWWGNLQERDHLKDLGIPERII
jgi:hypothetical protein